jgi:hypothetical protein
MKCKFKNLFVKTRATIHGLANNEGPLIGLCQITVTEYRNCNENCNFTLKGELL